jgi:lipopolysaccharide assembly outer membrane protein LptD (OstA)
MSNILKKRSLAVSAFIWALSQLFSVDSYGVSPGDAGEKAEDMFKMKKDQPIEVNGDKVEYFQNEGKIVAEGSVEIIYGDVKLTCDRIMVDTVKKAADCFGNVKITHPDGVMTGDHIYYDFTAKRGELAKIEVKAFPWFAHASKTARTGDNEYVLNDGFVTTCDYDCPHFRVESKEIKVYPDDKIIAKNAVIYVGNTPVLWMPYYYHPVIQSRAKVQIIPGQSSDWGYFLLTSSRFYIKGNTKFDVLLDYRTKKGFAEGLNFYYFTEDFGLKKLGEGTFRTYFIEQNDWGTYDPSVFRDTDSTKPELRKRFSWMHRLDFDDRTTGMLEFNKVSDENVIKDYFYNEYEENSQTPPNYVTVTTAQPNFLFTVSAEKRFNDCYTVTEKLPAAELNIPAQRLWNTYFYYENNMSAAAFNKQYAFDSQSHEKVERYNTYHRVSYVSKIGFLNVTPFTQFQESVYSRNMWEDAPLSREMIGGGVGTSCRFHRIYDYNTKAYGLDINGFRHIISPKAEYVYWHQPTTDKDELYQIDEIDAMDRNNSVVLSLENKLQTKRHDGPDLVTVDFARFIAGTEFFFNLKKGNLAFENHNKIGDIFLDTELKPYKWLYIESDLTVSPKKEALKRGDVEFVLTHEERFKLGFGYRYEKDVFQPRNQLLYDMEYVVNPKWKVGWYERFDMDRGDIAEQQFTITRDLHCWELSISYNVKGKDFLKDDHTFWFAFRIKAFPDLPIGLNRSFSRRPPGTMAY